MRARSATRARSAIVGRSTIALRARIQLPPSLPFVRRPRRLIVYILLLDRFALNEKIREHYRVERLAAPYSSKPNCQAVHASFITRFTESTRKRTALSPWNTWFFARRCFRSLPLIESLEQAKHFRVGSLAEFLHCDMTNILKKSFFFLIQKLC